MNSQKLFIGKLLLAALCITLLAGPATATDTTAPLGDILGVTVGMPESQAREILSPLGESAGRDTRSGGRKQGFLVNDERYAWVAYQARKNGILKWVSANLKQGAEIPFAELGDLSQADSANEYQVIWNVIDGDSGYRLIAKGQDGKASIVYLLALD